MEQDLFLDSEFADLDTRESSEHFATKLAAIADEEPDTPGLPEQEVIPETALVSEVEEEAQPEVIEAGDGMTVSIEKTSKGWKAILDANTGARPEVYEGKTQKEVLQQALVGKVHATRKINQLNKQVKLQVPQQAEPVPAQVTVEQAIGRELTSDEELQFNIDFKANPARALDSWFSKRVGTAPEKIGRTAKDSEEANTQSFTVLCATEAKEFILEHPEYYSIDENYHNLLKYIVNQKNTDGVAKTFLRLGNYDELSIYLTKTGHFTSTNLAEAYNELSEAGLLQLAPEVVPEIPPAPKVEATAPATPIREKARPTRAAKLPGSFGLHGRDTGTPVSRTADPAPSVDELENLNDEDVDKLFHATRAHVARTRR